ncbi:MAG TPA: TonB-dependent receptor plug domain-containing protein, partial [Stellaceae bacterium]
MRFLPFATAAFGGSLVAFCSAAAAAAGPEAQTLDGVEVVGSPLPPILGTAGAASEGDVPRERLESRPVYRPGELLETVPGLIATQHSGEGKANQYFLRGFDLDHGTDLAITVDGMPVNMRTHGHAQGYADINWLIPELVSGLSYRKGPYFADEGDFSSAGAVRIDYLDRLDRNLAEISGGSFGYWRGLAASSVPFGGGDLLAAAELQHYDGPWDHPDDLRKLNGILRFARGTPDDGFSITAMAYASRWEATNQIAQRAVDQGLIDRFGSLDPSDGGTVQRYSLSTRWAEREGDTLTRLNAYVIRSDLRLYNDFTYFLRDPADGDQFKQTDSRTILGGGASRTFFHTLA